MIDSVGSATAVVGKSSGSDGLYGGEVAAVLIVILVVVNLILIVTVIIL